MKLHFYDADGSPTMSMQYHGPGRAVYAQTTAIVTSSVRYIEGGEHEFHVGHGVMRSYRVEAVDAHDCLLLQLSQEVLQTRQRRP